MKIFISQPMAGKSDETILKERALFIEMVKLQIGIDKDVTFIDSFTKPMDITDSRIKMLGHSIMMMGDADLVVFLPGWSKSPGCLVEFEVCKQYGVKTLFIQEPIQYMINKGSDT